MSASHTAEIVQFPARRVQPMAVDLARAIPADTAWVEANRVRTRDVIAARTQGQRDELVSALLLTLEDNPLAPCLCYPSRDVGGHPFVAVVCAGVPFRLQPEDCRTAAAALVAEQAFPGCLRPAADLREAANRSEQRANAGRTAPVLAIASPRPGITGKATTLFLAALIALGAAASTLFGR